MSRLCWALRAYGLPQDRQKCAELLGVKVAEDKALAELRTAVVFSRMGFLDKGRDGIDRALAIDPAVFERAVAPDECWLLCAKAFAETAPERALAAFRHAVALNPASAHKVEVTWKLADLLAERGIE